MARQKENALKAFWRPLTAYVYLLICLFDFMIAPIALTYYCFITGVPYIHWDPLTLVSGGMFHMSMGAILGVAAWTRGAEKYRNPYEYEEPSRYSRYDEPYDRGYVEREYRPPNRGDKGGIDNSDEPLE